MKNGKPCLRSVSYTHLKKTAAKKIKVTGLKPGTAKVTVKVTYKTSTTVSYTHLNVLCVYLCETEPSGADRRADDLLQSGYRGNPVFPGDFRL